MKKNIFYLITAVVFLITACKKMAPAIDLNLTGQTPPGTNRVSFYTTALEFIKLPANRYFIYKDSATGSTDSVVVTQTIVETKYQAATAGYPGKPALYYDTYTLILTKLPASQIWYQAVATCDYFFLPAPSTGIDSNFTFYNDPSQPVSFWYPFETSNNRQYTFLPNLTIEGNTYSGVHQFFATNGLPPTDTNYQGTIFYWVKGIGIIKKEIRTFNSVKTSLLVRYG